MCRQYQTTYMVDVNSAIFHLMIPMLQVKDREAYYIDLQLLRVTKKLQAVLKGDRGERDKELVQKTDARMEMMEHAHESKVGEGKVALGTTMGT